MKLKKPVQFMLTILCVLQVVLIVVLISNRALIFAGLLGDNTLNDADVMVGIVIIVLLLAFYMIYRGLRVVRLLNNRNDEQVQMIANINEMNRQIRAQRHDFLNHIQIVYSLVELEEYAEARNYLHKIYGDIERVNTCIKTSRPPINALIQAKQQDAIRRGIDFQIGITTNLEKMKIPDWEFCRVLGNLIDNGLFAAEHFEGNKFLAIVISESLTGYHLEVSNSGITLSAEVLEKLFQPGFTTKGEKGEGMGLYIVQSIMDTYGGTVQVTSEEETTTFLLDFPF